MTVKTEKLKENDKNSVNVVIYITSVSNTNKVPKL